jgi:(5-formylfuran-3-yl)methyl phosphate synthase
MQLLVSVVNLDEVEAALSGGADLLDLKNPAEGSLGAPIPATIIEVRRAAPRPQLLSVAIGDMPDLPGTAALAAVGAAACGADYVKVGLWGPRTEATAVALLHRVSDALGAYHGVSLIAAGYADAERAGTLDPCSLPAIAQRGGAAGCLIDTAIKDGRPLFDFLAPETLADLVNEAHAAGLLIALAGALRPQDLPILRDLGADIVGVRSAVCRDGRRTGPLEAARVRQLRELLDSIRTVCY